MNVFNCSLDFEAVDESSCNFVCRSVVFLVSRAIYKLANMPTSETKQQRFELLGCSRERLSLESNNVVSQTFIIRRNVDNTDLSIRQH